MRNIPPAYIWKTASVLLIFLAIKLNFLFLPLEVFTLITVSFALASPVSMILLWGADITGQRHISAHKSDDASQLVASLCFGFVPAVIAAGLFSKAQLDMIIMTLAIALFRAISRYVTQLNIQFEVESKRAQTALTMTEPLLWAATSLLFIGVEFAGYGSQSFVLIGSKIFFAVILSLAAIIAFLPYRPPLSWHKIASHISWQSFLSKGKLSLAGTLNSTFVSLPVVMLTNINLTNEAAFFAVAQRYANMILLFEQVRSRMFSAKFITVGADNITAKTTLFRAHRKNALLTGIATTAALLGAITLLSLLALVPELHYPSLFCAICIALLTLLEFGSGSILLLQNNERAYIAANLISCSVIAASATFITSLTMSFAIFIAARVIYVSLLHRSFTKLMRNH